MSNGGTRFLIYPQFAQGFDPEVVEIGLPPSAIGPGPQDATLVVRNAIDKPLHYRYPDRMPPWDGPVFPPAVAGPDGHFDRIPLRTPQFLAAHLYGSTRRVLDIWEDLLGHPIVWWHAEAYPRLELIPWLRWGNAQSGPGFVETGMMWTRRGDPQDLALNFDVVAHEIGHVILFSLLGAPAPDRLTGDYLAFHEAFSDHTAVISSLYFLPVARRLLTQTRGNLYALNLVSRLGELAGNDEVRVLDNRVRMRDLLGLRIDTEGNWTDPFGVGRNQHDASAPLSGAIWDCLVELFQDALVSRGVIEPRLDTRRWTEDEVEASLAGLQLELGERLARFEPEFLAALCAARDRTGRLLARSIQRLPADDLSFAAIAAAFCDGLVELGLPHLAPAFVDNFLWRGIDPRALWKGWATRAETIQLGRASAGPTGLAVAGLVDHHPHRGGVVPVGA
jgi:hypothetical protein